MEIADNTFTRSLGLMFRKSGEMLFVFDDDVRFSVWTPFMSFPLDIFFLDKNKKVVDVKKAMEPWDIYRPKKSYRYFFEARAGKYRKPPKF